jgi:predicted lactoylglutathione lyase
MDDQQPADRNPRDQVFLALTSTSRRDVSEVIAKYQPIGWDVKVERVGSTWLVMMRRQGQSEPNAA